MSRRQAKRAAFAHRRRKWRHVLQEWRGFRSGTLDDRIDALGFFQREYLLDPVPQADEWRLVAFRRRCWQ